MSTLAEIEAAVATLPPDEWSTVHWSDAAVMAVGAVAGGYGGAGLARRVGRQAVRRAVVVIGVTMAMSLYLR